MSESLQRLQLFRIDGVHPAPVGILVDAYVSRVGVFPYQTEDGGTIHEYRPPQEVLSQASLDSLLAAPVTVLHPKEGAVTPDNWKKHAVGHVQSVAAQDGYIKAKLAILDADTIERVQRGDLIEISCGYRCKVSPASGVFQDQRYDAVQTDITYNHASLLPKGAGRQGPTVSLRLDSSNNVIYPEDYMSNVQRKTDGDVIINVPAPTEETPTDAPETPEKEAEALEAESANQEPSEDELAAEVAPEGESPESAPPADFQTAIANELAEIKMMLAQLLPSVPEAAPSDALTGENGEEEPKMDSDTSKFERAVQNRVDALELHREIVGSPACKDLNTSGICYAAIHSFDRDIDLEGLDEKALLSMARVISNARKGRKSSVAVKIDSNGRGDKQTDRFKRELGQTVMAFRNKNR